MTAVDTLEGLRAHVADVVADDLEARAALEVGERLATEVHPVEPTDLMAGVEQQFAQHGADVAACAGDEHRCHGLPPRSVSANRNVMSAWRKVMPARS